MEQIRLTINGQEVTALPGKTILEVIQENKLDTIPTLCHDKRVEHFTSCFLCVVESETGGKLIPSCSTMVSSGMKIRTRSLRIEETRKTALSLLMSNHYADCIGPCSNKCPAGVDAQAYIALISMHKYREALKLVKENNPLPLSIGRVCVRDCEAACRRKYIDEPVAVNTLKRFIADIDKIDMWKPELKKRKNRKVAVIGGGPAGLSCAYYLTVEGYQVTIYERLPELGGMLRYGIPEYRLPKKILDAEIKWITDLGVEVKTRAEAGVDFSIKELLSEGYDSVFLGVGAHKASKMGLKGEDTILGVFRGIDFLREIEASFIPQLKGTVVVVGGGNTAIDASRTALRCGADKVKIVYRRSLNEMPAAKEEIDAALSEGVEILFLTNPTRIISENNKLQSIECLKMRLETAGPAERPKPVPIEGSEFIIDCDYLIGAIGQSVESSFIKYDKDCQLEKWGTVKVENTTLETSMPGIFAGGDAVTGPLTAITSIAQGKKAALSIMSYLEKGKASNNNGKFYSFKHNLGKLNEKDFGDIKKLNREKMRELEITDRVHNFQEVEKGISEDQVFKEAARCLECGCSEYYDCSLRKYSDEYHINISDYAGEIKKYIADRRHPFIALDPNKCINCGRCVRTCTEILKVSALGFVYRGFKSVVKPAMEKSLLETNCISCGNCIDVCPTGAISEKFPFKMLGTLPKENTESVCSFCSIGCILNFKKVSDSIFYPANSTEEIQNSHNRGYLCSRGKFGHRFLQQKDRISSPRIRRHGIIENTSVNEALAYTSKKIKDLINEYGNDSIAVMASPRLSNEELYLVQKFARTALNTNQVSSFSDLIYGKEQYSLDDIFGFTASTVSMDDLQHADAVVVINSNLSEENLVMELKIKEAQKHGTQLVLISSSEVRLTKNADLWIDSKKGTNTLLINSLISRIIHSAAYDTSFISNRTKGFEYLQEMTKNLNIEDTLNFTGIDYQKFQTLSELLEDNNKNIIFIYNIDSDSDRSANCLKAIGNLLLLTSRIGKNYNGIIILREFNNSTGMYEMGVTPYYLPGYVKYSESEEIRRIEKYYNSDLSSIFKPVNLELKLRRGEIKGVIIFGEDPLAVESNRKYFNGIEFMAVMEAFHTQTTSEADVIIPADSYAEKEGSYTRCDGLIQSVEKISNGLQQRTNIETLCRLAGLFTPGFNYPSVKDVTSEINGISRSCKYSETGVPWIKNYFSNGFKQKILSFVKYPVDFSITESSRQSIHYQDNYYLCNIKSKLH